MAEQTKTRALITGLVGAVVRRVFVYLGAGTATHALFASATTREMVEQLAIAAALSSVDLALSAWNKYVHAVLVAKLEVWKATAQAQAIAMNNALVPPPTAADIAARVPDPKVTAGVVAKVMTAD